MDIETLLATYPRTRAPLPPAHQAVYEREYKLNRTRASFITKLSGALEEWMHRRIAAEAEAAGGSGGAVLEIGAGTLNHLPFEPADRARDYDVIEPFRALYEGSPWADRVRRCYADIGELPAEAAYDRIVSVAVLEHLVDLPGIVARAGLHLRARGVFQHGIPSEGGFLWGLAWRLTTGVGFRLRTGLPYGALIRHEHVNTAKEIVRIVRHFFADVKTARFPLPLPHASFYTYLCARHPRRDRCAQYLNPVRKCVSQ
ncbi:MAG: class I SAM-dependent methyltransferase [Deltaproteobacteria bacterium]|nr:class I SAM-dependent methyltransferase [Deltaproteobacteria bacterium]